MDASCAGVCRIPQHAWLSPADNTSHQFALVMLVEHPRLPEPTNLANAWTRSAARATADMRACEIACCLAEYVRHMGFDARAHVTGNELLDVTRLAVLAGLGVRRADGTIENPFIGADFSIAAVSSSPVNDTSMRAASLGVRCR